MTLQTYSLSEKNELHTLFDNTQTKKLAPILQANASLIPHLQVLIACSISKTGAGEGLGTGVRKCSLELGINDTFLVSLIH